jgi:hypothetical protein
VPLQCLGDLAATIPKILIPYFKEIFDLCANAVADPEKDDSYRHSRLNILFINLLSQINLGSLEVMVSFCESSSFMKKKAAATFIPALSW